MMTRNTANVEFRAVQSRVNLADLEESRSRFYFQTKLGVYTAENGASKVWVTYPTQP